MLVAGSPCALLLVRPGADRLVDAVVVPQRLLTTGDLEVVAAHPHGDTDGDMLRRLAAALHDPTSDDALSRAVTAATPGPLPGVSDLDGTPGSGLRGVTSELHADRVVAHAVLVGPPAWLVGHGVAVPDPVGSAAPARRHTRSREGAMIAVAWDGVPAGCWTWRRRLPPARPRRPQRCGAGESTSWRAAPIRTARSSGCGQRAAAGVVPVAVAVLVAAARSVAAPRSGLPPSTVWLRP